jgi:predicted nucleic acid binding AN1-type Zn finger protein
MEFYNLGSHCFFCHQKDFLPFQCSQCQEKFCEIHKFPEQHFCKKNQTKKKQIPIKMKPCQMLNCEENSIIQCNSCHDSFCSSHHLPEIHLCKKIKKQKMVMKSTIKLNEFKNLDSFGEENLPKNERFYLKVLLPLEMNLQPSLWHFRKSRTVGKVIDILAQQEKLKLFKQYNLFQFYGGIYLNPSETLENVLKSGDYVILEEGNKFENLKLEIGLEYSKKLIYSKGVLKEYWKPRV